MMVTDKVSCIAAGSSQPPATDGLTRLLLQIYAGGGPCRAGLGRCSSDVRVTSMGGAQAAKVCSLLIVVYGRRVG